MKSMIQYLINKVDEFINESSSPLNAALRASFYCALSILLTVTFAIIAVGIISFLLILPPVSQIFLAIVVIISALVAVPFYLRARIIKNLNKPKAKTEEVHDPEQ